LPPSVSLRLSWPLWLGILSLLALTSFAASLALGATRLPAATVWAALIAFDPAEPGQAVVRGMRLPRSLAGLAIGPALAAAGLMMQRLTRNPLADPGLMGVNAGAALAVVAGLWLVGPMGAEARALAATLGAGAAAAAVWALSGGRGGQVGTGALLRLPLVGSALTSLSLSAVWVIVLIDPRTREVYRIWTAGSLAAADTATLFRLLPMILAGLGLAALIARRLEALAMGAEIAAGLGAHPARTATVAVVAVTLLSAAAVALAGPLGFVGLVVPHAARRLAGAGRPGRVLVAALLLGAVATLACDTAGRLLAEPSEMALGLMLALLGGPAYLLLLARLTAPRGRPA
jgi:iron complex transport system permease protein